MKAFFRTCLYAIIRTALLGIPAFSVMLVLSAVTWALFSVVEIRPNKIIENIIDTAIYTAFLLWFFRSRVGKIYDEFCLFLTQAFLGKQITRTLTYQWLCITHAVFSNNTIWNFAVVEQRDSNLAVGVDGGLKVEDNMSYTTYSNIPSVTERDVAETFVKLLKEQAKIIEQNME